MRLKSQVLAETLFTEFIQRRHCDVPEGTYIEPVAVPALEAKIRLYQFTTILLAILNEAQKRPKFNSVREHFERLYFPPNIDSDSLQDVRAAMDNLSKLLSPAASEKALFWAHDWLAGIGIEENNPARLDLFALSWISYYTAVTDVLKRFNPAD